MLRPSAVLGGGVKSVVEAPHSFVRGRFPEPVEKTDLDGAALDTRVFHTLVRMKACRTWSGGTAIVMNDTEAPHKPFAGEGGSAQLS
ncbi:hypothetical protein [Burkholderia orbicola]|uniref:hypothetical protein n=1 Tax=Burkholderia orbicola TaxID=2978683 RepID=UPI000A5C8581